MIGLRFRTAGVRLAFVYCIAFMASGAVLLGTAFLLSGGVRSTAPALHRPDPSPSGAVLALQDELASRDRQMLGAFAFTLMLSAAGSLLIGRLLARRALRPLREITDATRRISADDLHRRLALDGPVDEVTELADTIDGLLARLEESFTAQRRFVANASHELRTPLATMRAALDVAVAKPDPAAQTVALADRLRPQLDRVGGLLEGLLLLARAQHTTPDRTRHVDLTALIESALTTHLPPHVGPDPRVAGGSRGDARAATGLRVTTDVPPGATVRGDPALLTRMVENVIDNAIRHNEDGGWISVVLDRGALVVENGGAVLDQADVDRLGRPFQRARLHTPGDGLGLSIVAAIAEAHHGRMNLTARAGGGLRVEIALPA